MLYTDYTTRGLEVNRMTDFLDELKIEQLEGEALNLAETIGIEAFKKLLRVYGGTSHLYIPKLETIIGPIRNRHIYEDRLSGKMSVLQIAKKYGLSDAYVRQIVRETRKSRKEK